MGFSAGCAESDEQEAGEIVTHLLLETDASVGAIVALEAVDQVAVLEE